MQRALAVGLFVLSACAKEEGPSPLERCRAGEHACCEDSECEGDELCDFDYICSPAPGGEVSCNEGEGDRACHAPCTAAEVDMPCAGGGVCAMEVRFQGGDHGEEVYLCR